MAEEIENKKSIGNTKIHNTVRKKETESGSSGDTKIHNKIAL